MPRLTKVFLVYITHLQVERQATLRILCGSQTLVIFWRHLQGIREAGDWGLVHRGSISGKFDREMGRVCEDTDGEKDGDRTVDE